jgi:16S rRNA (cytosine1402-N4)-methyltransferase
VFLLRPRDEGWVIDATVGMGGHAEAILSASARTVRLLGLDTDAAALAQARARLARFGDRVDLVHASFRRLAAAAAERGVARARAILLDLGVSAWQLEQSGRGLSFQADEPLDMRLDPAAGEPAAALLNRLPEPELARQLFEYGAPALRVRRGAARAADRAGHRAPAAAGADGRSRGGGPLGGAACGVVPTTARRHADLLATGGRLGVISFHSGEDRIVKQTFRALESAGFAELEPSPRQPADDEVRANPRARSAKLRVLERL